MGRHHDRKLAASVTPFGYGANAVGGHRSHSHRAHRHGNGNLPKGVGHRQNRQGKENSWKIL